MRKVYCRTVLVSCLAPLVTACGAGGRADAPAEIDADTAVATAAADAAAGGAAPRPAELQGPPLETPEPRPLGLLGPLVVPDTTAATTWLGQTAGLAYDHATNRLLLLDPLNLAVHEVTPAGRLVRSYGGKKGAGPGELRFADEFSWSASHVAIFAIGNGKLVLFDRNDGRFAGFSATSGSVVFALASDDEGIYRYAFPE